MSPNQGSVTRQRVRFGSIAGATVALAAVALQVPVCHAGSDTLLTLSRGPNVAETLELTLEDLAALPQVTVVTENEFVDGLVAFRGPLARDVIGPLAFGETKYLRFIAANAYSVEIPISDLRNQDVILATEADGKRLSRRDKGPLWLIYPITDPDDLANPLYSQRLIWQVVKIEPISP